MKIIADSGATKGDWRLVSDGGKVLGRYLSIGTNVSAMNLGIVCDIVSEACRNLVCANDIRHEVKEVWLYTAGVVTEEVREMIKKCVSDIIPDAEVLVEDDLTGAARAVCGRRPGIAAILGTGSNTCLSDGDGIVRKVCSGGFILGDEGSASALGKLFLSDYVKGLVPQEVADDFAARFPSDYSTIVANVYRSDTSPSGYLGSLAPFIMEHYGNPYIKEMVDGNFRSFINRSLKQLYTENLPVGVVGGFGYALREIFCRVAEEEGVKVSVCLPDPVEGLIDFHCAE